MSKSTPQPEPEYVSNLLLEAIDALGTVEHVLNRAANRCAGGPLPFSLELERAIEHNKDFIGQLEALLSDAEVFDEASDETSDEDDPSVDS